MSLRARSIATVVLVVAGLVALMTMSTLTLRRKMMDDRGHLVKSQVQSAVAVVRAWHDRAQRGELSDAAARKAALEAIAMMRWDGGTGYLFAFDSHLVMRMHAAKPSLAGTSMADYKDPAGRFLFRMMRQADRDGGGFTRYSWPKPGVDHPVDKVSYSEWFKPWDLHIGAGTYVDDVDVAVRQVVLGETAESLLVALAVIAALLLLVRFVLRTLGGEPERARAMAMRIADGDLRAAAAETPARPGSLMASLQDMRARLAATVAAVQQGADRVGHSAEQIAQGNDDLAQRTQEQAGSLEETAASMEQMAATVQQNSGGARSASQLAREARKQAGSGSDTVGRAVAAMDEIDASSKRIGDIVGLIDEIAFQTNLLALNAAVEAARAGEQGRGFAVVAGEVRTLAQRSADAAREIKTLIADSTDKVQAGSRLVRASGEVLNGIVERIGRVDGLVAEIAGASEEQANGVDQVNHAVMQIDEVTQHNAALVEEAAAASRELLAQADALRQRMACFRIDDSAPADPVVAVPGSVGDDRRGLVPADRALTEAVAEAVAEAA